MVVFCKRVNNYRTSNSEKGLTLVELSMAMVFVSFIVTILATSLANIMQTYNKGVWLSQINQAGRQLSRDISNQARYSGILSTESRNAIAAQRLCVGGISYVWNLQSQVDMNEKSPGKLKNWFQGESSSRSSLRLVRIDDPTAKYCKVPYIPVAHDSSVRNLLGQGASIEEFKVNQGVNGKYQIPLLSISMVVGTKGFDRPVKVLNPDANDYSIVDANANGVYPNISTSRWQCGEWIDRNGNNVRDSSDQFTPSKNQSCAFLNFNYTVYERVVPE